MGTSYCLLFHCTGTSTRRYCQLHNLCLINSSQDAGMFMFHCYTIHGYDCCIRIFTVTPNVMPQALAVDLLHIFKDLALKRTWYDHSFTSKIDILFKKISIRSQCSQGSVWGYRSFAAYQAKWQYQVRQLHAN